MIEHDFLACLRLRLASYFSFFVFLFFSYFFLHPGMFISFVSLRLFSSHLLLSVSTYFIVRVLSACCVIYPTPSRNSFVFYAFFFRSSYFSGGVLFCFAFVPGMLALDLPTLNLQRLVFLSLAVTTEFVYL